MPHYTFAKLINEIGEDKIRQAFARMRRKSWNT